MSGLHKWQNPNPANACWNLSVLPFGDYRVYFSGQCEMSVTHIILMCVSENPKEGSPSERVAQLEALCDNTCVILYISISPRQEGGRHAVTLREADTQIPINLYGIQYFCKWEKRRAESVRHSWRLSTQTFHPHFGQLALLFKNETADII